MAGTATISWLCISNEVNITFGVVNNSGSLVTMNSVTNINNLTPPFSPVADGTFYPFSPGTASPTVSVKINVTGVGNSTIITLYKNAAWQQSWNSYSPGDFTYNPITVVEGDQLLIDILSSP